MNLPDQTPLPSRREARRLDRRDMMLTVAENSFLEDGYAATTMSGIAAAIGGSKATLWSYFPSKEALFEAVLDRTTSAYRARMLPLLNPSGDPEPTLRGFCTTFIERITEPKAVALYRLACAEAGRFPEMGRIFYERGPRTTRQMLGAFIESAMARKLLRVDDPQRAARTLAGLCFGGCHLEIIMGLIDKPTPEQIAADADHAMDIFLRAYAVPAE